jgi:hypothetical protein
MTCLRASMVSPIKYCDELGLSNRTMLHDESPLAFNVFTFVELESGSYVPRTLIRQNIVTSNAQPVIIELKNPNLAMDSGSVNHLRKSIALLVWQQMGRRYKDITMRAHTLIDSYTMMGEMFGSLQISHVIPFTCSAQEYLPDEVPEQTAALPVRSGYRDVMGMPKTIFTVDSMQPGINRPRPQFSAVPLHYVDDRQQLRQRIKIQQFRNDAPEAQRVTIRADLVGGSSTFALVQGSDSSASQDTTSVSCAVSRAGSPIIDLRNNSLPPFNAAFSESYWSTAGVPADYQSLRGEDGSTEHHKAQDDYPMHSMVFARDLSNPGTPSGSAAASLGWGGGGTTGIALAPLISAQGTPEKRKHHGGTLYFDEQPSQRGDYSVMNSRRVRVTPSLFNGEDGEPFDIFEEGIQPI